MTKDKSILIRNIYYMLSYAFTELHKNNYENIGSEKFENIHDLFAEILFRAISDQLKHGLHREYISCTENLQLLHGKLNMPGTIANRINNRRCQLCCEYDEFSENNLPNRIIKTAASLLLHNPETATERKSKLRQIMPFFSGIDEIALNTIKWDTLTFNKGERTYVMLMNICYFIIEEILQTTTKGKYQMATFTDTHMEKLFERFVLEYYRRHYKHLAANPDKVEWNIDTDKQPCMTDFLPAMKSDIMLHNGNKILIIDTKYYSRAMQYNFDKATIHSANLYQIFSYVKNHDKNNSGNVSGLLLYAKTDEEIAPTLCATFGKNRISVDTIDLNQDFSNISTRLKHIAEQWLAQ